MVAEAADALFQWLPASAARAFEAGSSDCFFPLLHAAGIDSARSLAAGAGRRAYRIPVRRHALQQLHLLGAQRAADGRLHANPTDAFDQLADRRRLHEIEQRLAVLAPGIE